MEIIFLIWVLCLIYFIIDSHIVFNNYFKDKEHEPKEDVFTRCVKRKTEELNNLEILGLLFLLTYFINLKREDIDEH